MASMFQVFDLKEAALSGEKQQACKRRYFDGGFEAPRNSLDVPDEAADVSRTSSFKPEDIPFGYEYYNPALAASIQRSKRNGTSGTLWHDHALGQSQIRKRAPSVVARLMGLDDLPDEFPPVRPRKSLQEMPTTYGRSSKPGGRNPVVIKQRLQGAVPSSWQRPPLPRYVQSQPANVEEERVLAPVLHFRDHPQEEQLQKFKKEFEAKQQVALAKKQDESRALQLEDMNRQLEEKKNKVRATLDKARSALSQGVVAEPYHLNAGQEEFEEFKEFLDAMEFLQSNKDFIFQFLQQKPHIVFGNENSNSATLVTHLKTGKKGMENATGSPGDRGERKRGEFSPRAFARLFKDPRKRNDNKQQPATSASDTGSQSLAGSQPTIDRSNSAGTRRASTQVREMLGDVKLRTSSSTNPRSELPPPSPRVQSKSPRDEVRSHNTNGTQDVIVEIKERLRQREQREGTREEFGYTEDISKEHLQASLRNSKDIAREIAEIARDSLQKKNFTLTKGFSPGKRVPFHRVNVEDATYTSDGEELSTPSVTIVRESVRRPSISLPTSPRLSARSSDVPASPRVVRKRATEKSTTPPTDSTDFPTTLRAAKKVILTSDSPGCGSQARGSPPSNTEAEKSMRRSASVTENASQREALKQRVDVPVAATRKCQDQINELESNVARSRSVPNVALLRERGRCTSEAAQKIHSSRGASRFEKSIKTICEAPKHTIGQNAAKRRGFLSVGRKKSQDGSEAVRSGQPSLFPSTAPVLARVAALGESCVSQSSTLSDTDSAANIKTHVRRSSRKAGAKKGENPRAQIVPSEKVTYPETGRECLEPSPAEESVCVISESSADSIACEDEFLEVLSQLSPLAKSTAESEIAGEALPSTFFARTAQQQIQNDKKTSNAPRAWTTVPSILDNVDEGDDSNSDKNGQPSPVSVLEATFEEESSSPLEFKEIANSLQELRIRLRLLKAEGGERIRDDLEINVPKVAADTQRAETQHSSLHSARENQTLTLINLPQQNTNADKPLVSNRQLATTESLNLQDLPCPPGHEADLAFVSHILVSSGFTTHGGRTISRWHSATHPISHHLFTKLEASYSDKHQSSHRRILFYAINEILARKLGPQSYEPWLHLSACNATDVRTGRRLVSDVWNEISKRQFPAGCDLDLHNDYLESLVAQDLKMSTSAMPLQHHVHRICLQLEKAIFSDLIKELCGGLLV